MPLNDSFPSNEGDTHVSAHPIVIRKNRNPYRQMNRRAALHGMNVPMESPDLDHMDDLNVHVMRVSPRHLSHLPPHQGGHRGGVVDSCVGKVSDLVKQFDENHTMEDEEQGGSRDGGERGQDRKKLLRRTIDIFENNTSTNETVRYVSACTYTDSQVHTQHTHLYITFHSTKNLSVCG